MGGLTVMEQLLAALVAVQLAGLLVAVYDRFVRSTGGPGVVERLAHEPVLVAGAVGSVGAVLVKLGIIPSISADLENTIAGAIVAIALIFARGQVTPIKKLRQAAPKQEPPDGSAAR